MLSSSRRRVDGRVDSCHVDPPFLFYDDPSFLHVDPCCFNGVRFYAADIPAC